MKIGLLAYHSACNFGAFLQLLSTVEYVRRRGDNPVVINWVPKDFRLDYEKRSLPEVRRHYSDLREQYYPMTRLCESAQDVATVIEVEKIQAVIIGSDAVLQHHPFRECFHFPVRRIVYIAHPTSDRMYPNCFWGEFIKYLKNPVPVSVISGSSQDSKYFYITGRRKRKMKESIMQFVFISVRDKWTQQMISFLTDGEMIPAITPDPVFAFNQNAAHLIPSRKDIIEKFNIPEKYFLISFKGPRSVNQEWITIFENKAHDIGYACVKLPYADARAFGTLKYDVGADISPLDWYALIKYSCGYVGNNMHPIVTSIHNGVPFFSFDNYGIKRQKGHFTNGESSKIYHLLQSSDLLDYREYIFRDSYIAPSPEKVLHHLLSFNTQKENAFAFHYLKCYNEMMATVFDRIKIDSHE